MQKVHPQTGVTVDIKTPANGANVPGNGTFHCYGTCHPTDCTYTATAVYGTSIFNGTAVAPQPGDQFGFLFTGCPVGVLLNVTVTGTDSGGTGNDQVTITCTNP
jgi:hypothetical protein